MSDSVLVEGEFTSLGAPARAQQSRPYRRFRVRSPIRVRSYWRLRVRLPRGRHSPLAATAALNPIIACATMAFSGVSVVTNSPRPCRFRRA